MICSARDWPNARIQDPSAADHWSPCVLATNLSSQRHFFLLFQAYHPFPPRLSRLIIPSQLYSGRADSLSNSASYLITSTHPERRVQVQFLLWKTLPVTLLTLLIQLATQLARVILARSAARRRPSPWSTIAPLQSTHSSWRDFATRSTPLSSTLLRALSSGSSAEVTLDLPNWTYSPS